MMICMLWLRFVRRAEKTPARRGLVHPATIPTWGTAMTLLFFRQVLAVGKALNALAFRFSGLLGFGLGCVIKLC
jgi:hypothetical protein